MKKVVFFTGAGISQESGVNTFRDKGGLWENVDINEVATISGWKKDRERVLRFYNKMRRDLASVSPNLAHTSIAELEGYFDVSVITQNVDDLHEKAGSKNIIHIHGELMRAASSMSPKKTISWLKDITIGDKHEDGSQLRPNIVWFGENPFEIDKASDNIRKSDYLVIVGTSLSINYIIPLLGSASLETKIIYVDPNPSEDLTLIGRYVIYIREKASIGVPEAIKLIKENYI